MYPPRFRYEAPTSVAEVVGLLADDPDAKVLAGGQSLVPMMKLRFSSPSLLVDINGVPGLDHHRVEADGALVVGALCRHADLEFSDRLADFPLVAQAAPLVADPIVRNRGTLVGSLCHSDPQGDWATVLLALDGVIVAQGQTGRRTIAAADFGTGPFENALEPGEVAVEARVPAPRGTPYACYLKLERRVGDFATAGVAVALETIDGEVVRAGVALTGVGPANIKVTEAEQVLLRDGVDDASVAEAARLASAAATPKTDHRGSAEYKRQVIATFVRRALDSYRAKE
jgi:aerobic carbon-monoxide dehydrogenase medium subunit